MQWFAPGCISLYQNVPVLSSSVEDARLDIGPVVGI